MAMEHLAQILEPARAETYIFLLFNHIQIHSGRLTSFRQLCSDRHFVNQTSKTMGKRVIFLPGRGGGEGGVVSHLANNSLKLSKYLRN